MWYSAHWCSQYVLLKLTDIVSTVLALLNDMLTIKDVCCSALSITTLEALQLCIKYMSLQLSTLD
jgi:hypothetical protein